MAEAPLRKAPHDLGINAGDKDPKLARREVFDDHGFVLPPEGDTVGDSSRAYARWFQPKAQRRSRRFESQRKSLIQPGLWTALPKSALKALLRKGVPTEHRREVWWSVLGCEARRKRSLRSYAQYLEAANEVLIVKTAEEIDRDLQRTYPNHQKFRELAGQAELRNVLRAFAHHSPRVQYCQGLNYIAALMLIVFVEEETAFWGLVCAVEALGAESYYTEGMTLLRADMYALAGVLEQQCPKVAKAFAANKIELISICSEWFITWFAKSLPVPTILRVWDTLFFEGFKILFRVALGVFKLVESEIVSCTSFEDIMERAKDWPRCMVNHNELLKASFKGVPGLRRKDLLRTRDTALCRVEREDVEKQRRVKEAREKLARERAARQAAEAQGAGPAARTEQGQPW